MTTITSAQPSALSMTRASSSDVVADHRLQAHVEADGVQPFGDEERVRVDAKRRQHLAADARMQAFIADLRIQCRTPRKARLAYTAAIASSAITPRPPGRRSRRFAGYGLTTSTSAKQQEAERGARPADGIEKEGDEHPHHLVDDHLTGVGSTEMALGDVAAPRPGDEHADDRDGLHGGSTRAAATRATQAGRRAECAGRKRGVPDAAHGRDRQADAEPGAGCGGRGHGSNGNDSRARPRRGRPGCRQSDRGDRDGRG